MRPSPTVLQVPLEKATKMTVKKKKVGRGSLSMSSNQSVTHTKLELSSINDRTPVGTVCFSWAALGIVYSHSCINDMTSQAQTPPLFCSFLHTPSLADISITQLPKCTAKSGYIMKAKALTSETIRIIPREERQGNPL